jgi:LmbE family N-acetylglucosaminyl deacetylase
MPLDDREVERVLVVVAHPDDLDFGVAGSIAGWVDAGIEVAYCIVTDGDAGGFDPAVARADIAGIRRAEQLAAAAVLGVEDVTFLGYPDGYLDVTIPLRRDIARQIRRVRPQRVVTQSPERNWQRVYASHPDHLAAGEATLRAVYPDARNPFFSSELLDEGHEAWAVTEVWLAGHPAADHVVDVTAAVDRKFAALDCHVSQETRTPEMRRRVRDWMRRVAVEGGLGEDRAGEAFLIVPTA